MIVLFAKLISFFAGFFGLGFLNVNGFVWAAYFILATWLLGMPKFILYIVIALSVVLLVPILRRTLLTSNIMSLLKSLKLLPKISETERVALEAGGTWVDKELFSGEPDFKKVRQESFSTLTQDEKDFLSNQVTQVCKLMDNGKAYEDGDLSPEVWQYLKDEKFFGLIIPKQFDGLGFSALAHSEIVSKLSSHSIPLAISVMVPNSLGPAELLVHYGTDEQKDNYLPKLAVGTEIPCFGLTEPQAGSDAGSMQSTGVVFRGEDNELYLRINWEKRYITLGAVATVIGLAVKLEDPDHLIGDKTDLGITCVMIPKDTAGVQVGRRHDALGVPFINSPIMGKDVVVTVDQIIGGAKYAGKGWQMLMESLACGRAISLPSQSTGGMKMVTKGVSAYAKARHQFGISISNFEGIAEVLAKMGALTYITDSTRMFTLGAIDHGVKPSVVSAIVKYTSTEAARQVVNAGMDICGGAGISQGPKNFLALPYTAAPIAITVEGANILTRTMIIFGQGAIRCHPFAYREVVALEENNMEAFDYAFFGHIQHVVKNLSRSVLLSFSRGKLASAPKGPNSHYYQKLSWVSSHFAVLADLAMATLGGKLKQKEQLTGAFADIFSWMYLLTSVLRRYEADGLKKDQKPLVDYSMAYGFEQIQKAMESVLSNIDVPVLGWLLKKPIYLWVRLNGFGRSPSHKSVVKIAKQMTKNSEMRKTLVAGVYDPQESDSQLNKLETVFQNFDKAVHVLKHVEGGIKSKILSKGRPFDKVEEALEKGLITEEQGELLSELNDQLRDVIQVDSFGVDEYKSGRLSLLEAGPS